MKATRCTVPDCYRDIQARGWCLPHYKRWRRWGDPQGSRPVQTYEEVFDRNADRNGDCWEWRGTIQGNGYAVMTSKKKRVTVHRWSYEQFNGPIPEGMVIDHLCRNRSCVNPSHLEAVTHLENLRRGEGYALKNGMRSTCIHGHEYTPENTYTHPNGVSVRCRECSRIRDRKRAK